MRIPENKIEEIRSAANIVDIISEYVQLRKRGKNYIGLCPFHNEKTPSFTVSEEKQIYHCFGCHAGGNIFKFLMEYEKISFVESIQELAQRLSITLEYDEEQISQKQSEQEELYDINTAAARYFSDSLLNKDEGEIARNYFHNRKIKVQTLRAFGLGYALPARDSFIEFAKEKRMDFEKALSLGLIGQNNDGRLYDKFSGRIIFPIFSPNGRVVAFAGRILENRENTAKYLNSPESSIYVKGKILYGLSHAKDEIRKLDKAILVEGYMDLISLYQSGIKNVVAVSGTALTEEQVQLLSRYTKNVVLLFDADAAGIKASMRSIELLLKRDIEIKIVSLPAGEDPDSYVNKYGNEKFEELIKKAQNFLEYQSAFYESQGMFADSAKLAEAIRELVKPIALISDELKRSLLIKSIAKKFNLREMLLEAELDKITKRVDSQLKTDLRIKEERLEKEEKLIVKENTSKANPVIYNLEREIVKLLFEGNESVIKLISKHINIDEFYITIHSQLAQIVYNAYLNEEEIIAGALIDKLNDEKLQAYVLELTFDPHSISKNWESIHPGPENELTIIKKTRDIIKSYKLARIDQEISKNIKTMELAENENEKLKLMKINRDLKGEKTTITLELSDKNNT